MLRKYAMVIFTIRISLIISLTISKYWIFHYNIAMIVVRIARHRRQAVFDGRRLDGNDVGRGCEKSIDFTQRTTTLEALANYSNKLSTGLKQLLVCLISAWNWNYIGLPHFSCYLSPSFSLISLFDSLFPSLFCTLHESESPFLSLSLSFALSLFFAFSHSNQFYPFCRVRSFTINMRWMHCNIGDVTHGASRYHILVSTPDVLIN